MNKCEHNGLFNIECDGTASVTTFGYLCIGHAYRAFLAKRSGKSTHEEYSVKSEDDAQTDMFKDDER